MKKMILLLLSVCMMDIAICQKILVPDDYQSIQQAVDSSASGDTVLVAPGRYYENLNFRGKNIVVASHYVLNGDTEFILSTIIDGSQPKFPDTASCVFFVSGEDSTAVLQGFTITGGKGTPWPDVEFGGTLYREGGGILIDSSSPSIKNNYIVNNILDNAKGVQSYGGGAIRMHTSYPHIENNLLIGNAASYGGCIVVYHSGGVFSNNIIVGNRAGTDYGGDVIWVSGSFTKPLIFTNNLIGGNFSANESGAMGVGDVTAEVKNNIIWGNWQRFGKQLTGGSQLRTTYNCIQDNLEGEGNIAADPDFTDSLLYLADGSPCIDAGITDTTFNDAEDTSGTGNAKWPSKGSVRNDIGPYGGPMAGLFPNFHFNRLTNTSSFLFDYKDITGGSETKKVILINQGTDKVRIDSVVVRDHKAEFHLDHFPSEAINALQSDSIILSWQPRKASAFSDTLMVYNNATGVTNPLKVIITTKVSVTGVISAGSSENSFSNYPDPFRESTVIRYSPEVSDPVITLYDLNGRVVRRITPSEKSGEFILYRNDLPSGVYILRLTGRNITLMNKMMIIE